MFSFNKIKAFLFIICALSSIAFLFSFIAVLFQNQPLNIAVVSALSSIITGTVAIMLGRDLFKEVKTMKVDILIEKGTPFSIESLDIEDVHITNLNKKIDKKRFNIRDIVAHVIHYYEERKSLGVISKDSLLQVNFKEVADVVVSNEDINDDETIHPETTTTDDLKPNKDELIAEKSA